MYNVHQCQYFQPPLGRLLARRDTQTHLGLPRSHVAYIPCILSSCPPPIPYFNISMSVFVCQYLTWSVIIHLMSFIVITFWPADVLVLDAMATAPVNTVILSGLMLVCKCWEVALMSRPVVSVLKVSAKFCSNFHMEKAPTRNSSLILKVHHWWAALRIASYQTNHF